MICRLCLLECEQYKNIFDSEGCELKMSSIITKLLFIEIETSDPVSTIICESCWFHLENFHIFYCRIEEAQKKLSETLIVKEECHVLDVKDDISIDECTSKNDEKENIIICDENVCLSDESIEEMKTKIINNATKKTNGEQANQRIESTKDINEKEHCEENDFIKDYNKEINPSSITNESQQNSDSMTNDDKKKENVELSNYIKKRVEMSEEIAKHIKLECEICSEEFPSFTLVVTHYREVHKTRGYITCCNKKFFIPKRLLEHIKKHSNPDHFRCEPCGKTFADGPTLWNHNLLKHSEERNSFKCDKCPKSFPREYMLNTHKLIHMPKEERKHFCETCGKAFPTESKLKQHIKIVHEKKFHNICDICGKSIFSKKGLEKHQLIEHEGIIEPKAQCQECGAWFKNAHGLKTHMERHALREEELSNPKDYVCETCGRISKTRGAHRSHIQNYHRAKPRHRCPICDKGFKLPKRLREHLTTHTGQALYACPYCSKAFNCSSNMHSHKKHKHPEEWETERKKREEIREFYKKKKLEEKSM